jgi:hypothetical protein
MTSYLPTELWHLILSHNSTLSIYAQRSTSRYFKAIIERIFLQRHGSLLQGLKFIIREQEPGQFLRLQFLRLCPNKHIAFFEATERDLARTRGNREIFKQLKRNVDTIRASAMGDDAQRQKCAKLFVIQGRRAWHICTGDIVPLFDVVVSRKGISVGFAWMPMVAVVLREKEERARSEAMADMVIERAVRLARETKRK